MSRRADRRRRRAAGADTGTLTGTDHPVLRLAMTRLLGLATVAFGIWYVSWRWSSSVNWAAWWIAVPLVVAETYSLVDGILFAVTMWRSSPRPAPPPPDPEATVDVFITTYNEPVELVAATADAARAITWPHRTWILDDGDRAEMAAAAERLGIGYVTRSADWADRPRHAKAGNLNNALMATSGEFLLILDADQIPAPDILDRTLGYFRDPEVALVQTPQWFTNVPDSDPLGSQAPLFYGPIQQGKDGWNAAFFCGSNAVLRREALMRIGVAGYVTGLEAALRRTLGTAGRILARARRQVRHNPAAASALADVSAARRTARRHLDAGEPLAEITYRFQQAVRAAAASIVADDMDAINADLAALEEMQPLVERAGASPAAGIVTGGAGPLGTPPEPPGIDPADLQRLTERDWSPIGALSSVAALVEALDVDRGDEAQAVMPLATISVTEDMATAMRLHANGWRSVYHHEVLARGLAPEDVGTMMQQRLRWAQGTLQVMLRENPLVQRGLSIGQRLMYFATMWSYLSGFAAVAFIIAPVLYLMAGVRPVHSFGGPFLEHLLPYLIANQLMFFVVGYGVRTWRGHQYSLALFPLWIRACATAVGNVVFRRSLGFVVTPKTREGFDQRAAYRVVRVQLVTMAVLLLSTVVGVIRLILGVAPSTEGTILNVVWVAYDVLVMSVVVEAARYRGYEPQEVAP